MILSDQNIKCSTKKAALQKQPHTGWYTREDKGINDQIIIYGKIDFIFFSSLQHEFFITYAWK